ncbi:MAG: hypothetical protein ABFS10_12485 [Bacteroidota bacterium]
MRRSFLKTNIIVSALLILFGLPVVAQPTKSLKESSLNPLLNKYKDYEAVIIEDLGRIEFIYWSGEGFSYVFERTMQFKINSSSGLDWAEIEIPLYQGKDDHEKLNDVSIKIINADDQRVWHYEKKDLDIYEEVYNKNYLLKKFAVPNAKEGSVIEVSYSTKSPYLYYLEDWMFQYDIPVLYSRLEVAVVPFFEYALLKRGPHKLTSFYHYDSPEVKKARTTPYRERTYHFVMTEVPAFEDESFITSRNDYIDRIDFQLRKQIMLNGQTIEHMTDWFKVNKELLSDDNFGKYVKSASKLSKDVAGLHKLQGGDRYETINGITSQVKQTIKWNGKKRPYAASKAKQVFEEKEGSSAEINLFLVGMLNAAGIEAYPLLLSTRDHGRVYKDKPMLTNFNDVIACIPNGEGYILRDATNPLYPDDQLPVRCLNGEGLLVKKDVEKWVPLGTASWQSQIRHQVLLEPLPGEQSLNSIIDISATGYDAVAYKKRVGDDPDEVEELFGNDLISDFDSVSIQSGTTAEDSFNVRIITKLPLENIGDHMFIHPFAALSEQENKLTRKSRSYPVDMVYEKSRIFRSEIRIPEGYTATFVPEKYTFNNDLITLNYLPELSENNVLNITAEIRFHKRIYPPKDYKKLRYFYSDMVKRFNEKIILEAEKTASAL